LFFKTATIRERLLKRDNVGPAVFAGEPGFQAGFF
jgi:hypothetical protein